ncbi:hypothetical protein EV191_1082 [Tamaricihabitans halophyticus]|uniref:AAA ATPase-like protein n=1 Tax=Tamaricihabitans halophyticus TaxID=1262583 RepID=A0A4V2ST85_9PSEU|nr:hypothetical protein [Tamaricihabitans halophyticus]TCP49916.1 hypothetical protein EV191_1082 [Tamaricihabitans halophyticus]
MAPAARSAAGAAKSGQPKSAQGNLPRHGSSLVGRADEIDETLGLLADNRLLTVLGIGGVGKTRLATAVADRLLEPGEVASVWFVDLTVLGNGAGAGPGQAAITQLVSNVLGLASRGEEADPIDQIATAVQGRDILLPPPPNVAGVAPTPMLAGARAESWLEHVTNGATLRLHPHLRCVSASARLADT